jgi:hypothetical protein
LKNVLSAEEQMVIAALRKHLVDHAGHYNRAIVLSRDADTVAIEFQKAPWLGTNLLDHAQPYALEVFGDFVAFPMTSLPEVDANLVEELYTAIHGNDPARHAWVIEKLATLSKQELEQLGDRLAQARAHAEKLITLPARGVFAEGKLGHCNLSEEIDETRFWRWGEHKLPFEAPKIDAVHPITPTPQGVTATPTNFPASLVNIVNPTAAPDPTGLAAALKVLQTPDIFRDMSAKAEVANLLEDLIGGSIDIAEAANRARNIKAAGGSESGGTSGPGSTGRGGGWDAGGGRALPSGGQSGHDGSGAPSGASPSRRDSPREQLDQLQLYRSALRNGDISEEEYQQLASGYLFSNVKGGGTPATPPPTKVRQAFVDQIASINFANGTDINNWFLAQTGKEFIDWFNATHAAKGFWADQYVRDPVTGAVVKDAQGHAKVEWSGRTIPNNAKVKQHFVDFWDRIPLIYAPAGQIGLIDFISLMAIGINEKSGDLVSIGEIGSLKYMFEAGAKSSYNVAPNRNAFDLFNDAKFNQAHDTKVLGAQHKNTANVAWKGQVWPVGVPTSTDPAATGYIREADFYKFRGRGIIQTTWRSAYVGLIDFVRAYTGPNATIQTFKTNWTAGVPADIATTSSNAEWDQLFGEIDFAAHAIAVHSNSKGGYLTLDVVADDGANGGLNGHYDKQGTIRHIGRSIGWPSYGEIFYKRVVQMLNSLGNDPAITSGNTPAAGGGVHI